MSTNPPENTQLRVLDLAAIVPSLTNPRKHFDQVKLQELTASIATSGVHQPILVRPLPAERLQETFTDRRPGTPLPTHEVVAGERRFRASALAKQATIPVMVRDLTDEQVLEIQIVENLQRDDLTELEEAEGYERLMRHSGLNAEQVGAKIGKSKSYVYAKLKLNDLCQEGRKALREGDIDASKALLVARIPNESLQIKALAKISEKAWNGDHMSYREAARMVQRDFMLRLDAARFKIEDAQLVLAAGDCLSCTKRTGHSPELFTEVESADVCTDTDCYQVKNTAHDEAMLVGAKDRGLEIIKGKQAREIWKSSHSDDLAGYKRLDKPDHRTGSGRKTLKTLLGDDCPDPILLQSPHDGTIVEVVALDKANKILKNKGLLTAGMARVDRNVGEHEAKAKIEAKFQRIWRRRAIAATFTAVQQGVGGLSYPVIRQLARELLNGLVQDDRQHTAELLGIGKVADAHGITQYLKDCDDIEAEHALQLLLMQHDMRMYEYSTPTSIRIEVVAADFNVDLSKIQATVKDEQQPKPKAEAVPPATANEPRSASRPGNVKKPTRKVVAAAPKTTPAEAKEDIATALQALKDQVAVTPAATDAWPFPTGGLKSNCPEPPAAHASTTRVEVKKKTKTLEIPAARAKPSEESPPDVAQPKTTLGGAVAPQGNESGPVADALAPAAPTAITSRSAEAGPAVNQPSLVLGYGPGQMVKVNNTATRRGAKYIGRTGRITAKTGATSWQVLMPSKKIATTCIFDESELDIEATA